MMLQCVTIASVRWLYYSHSIYLAGVAAGIDLLKWLRPLNGIIKWTFHGKSMTFAWAHV